jgi:arylsulfatase A-like enzyme
MKKLLLSSLLFSVMQWLVAEQPNILLIVSDDQGWPDLGCIGSKPIRTPALDRLAAEGVRATSFYMTWPACTPSRGSLLTGRYPQRNGLYDMVRNDLTNYGHLYTAEEYAVSPEMTLGLDVKEQTLGDMLGSDYERGVVGKWDMGQARRYLPLQRGFEFFYGIGNNGIDYYTHERYGVPSMFRGNERTKDHLGTYATEAFEQEALRFIKASTSKPWFLYLCFNAPHGASSFGPTPEDKKSREGVQCPPEYAEAYAKTVKDEKLRRYYGAVTRMDEAIGRVMEVIQQKGQRERTLTLFMSDNGGSGNGGNAPLKGSKSTMWEGGLRVPFIAHWPAQLPAGRVTDEFITSLEVLPTLASITGKSLPSSIALDGFNMLSVLKGQQGSPRKSIFWQRRSDKAARIGSWKWIESAKGGGLFNLAEDLGEKTDLSSVAPDKLAELQAGWQKWRSEMDATEPRGPFRDY